MKEKEIRTHSPIPGEGLAPAHCEGDEPTESQPRGKNGADPPAEDHGCQSLGLTRVMDAPSSSEDAIAERDAAYHRKSTGDSSRRLKTTLGEFLLVRKLGRGAMATVYKARHVSSQRKFAVKVLHKHIAENEKLVKRFQRENQIMRQLDHPNIVKGYPLGEEEGFLFFAMEYVSGASLQAWLNQLGSLSAADAVHITIACAKGLEYAHQRGLVHRDVKPDNILITKQGEVKIADLGMVKASDEDMSLTLTGHAVGTPWYMPLEQAKNSKDADARSDIYALGSSFYFMLTGKLPFRGDSIVDVIRAKEQGTFPPARQFNEEVPERLDLIIAKMAAKYPQHRYASCSELQHDLEALDMASPRLAFCLKRRKTENSSSSSTRRKKTATAPQETSTSDDWYLRRRTPTGDVVYEKHSTNELIELLETEQLSPHAKVSRHEFSGYRAMAAYKEFKSIALVQATKRGADRQTVSYRELYKQFEEEDNWREQQMQEHVELDESIAKGLGLALRIGGGILAGLILVGLLILFIGWAS